MLSPDKIRDIEFEQSVIGGYRRDEVDKFLDEVEENYRKLYNDNKTLAEKMETCLEKIENYRKDEEFLKTAIINAQKLNETTLREIEIREKEAETTSKEKAAKIIADAENHAKELMHNAEIECADAVRAARERSKAEIDAEQKIANDAIKGIRAEIEAEQKKLDYLKTQVSEFKNTIIEIYRAHVTSISQLPDFKAAEEPASVVETEPVRAETSAAPVKEEAPAVEETVAVEKPVAVEEKNEEIEADPIDKNTVEFKIEPKEEKKEVASKASSKVVPDVKFDSNFKFGVDYDINKDE